MISIFSTVCEVDVCYQYVSLGRASNEVLFLYGGVIIILLFKSP
jgi:hypothetical protein